MVEIPQLRIAAAQLELLPVRQSKRHPAGFNREHLGSAAGEDPETGAVTGPADPVAGAKLDSFSPIDLGVVCPGAGLRGIPGEAPTVPAPQ